jgi:hypothetical protein
VTLLPLTPVKTATLFDEVSVIHLAEGGITIACKFLG